MLTSQVLFNAKWWGNHIHYTVLLIFFGLLFLKRFFVHCPIESE